MKKFQSKKLIFLSMVSSILLSIAPLYSMAILNTRKSEDFTVLLLLLLTLPIVLGAPISLLHLLVFKKNISADTARKLIFFPSIWIQIFIAPFALVLTCSILGELFDLYHLIHVKWLITAIIIDGLSIFYLFYVQQKKKKIKESFFDEDK